MADDYAGPFAGVSITRVIVQATQTALNAQIDLIIALIPDPTTLGTNQPIHPDFDRIPPHTAELLRAELAALKTAIDAAPHA